MKKIIILLVCLICLCGCSNEHEESLIGEWRCEEEPEHLEGGWGNIFSYEFKENGKVTYYECLHLTLTDEGCVNGSSVWVGKYKLNNNIITMYDFKINENDSYNPSKKLNGPSSSLIVNFDNMYFCDREDGLDCKNKYEKDH